jgi:4-amino-4-deoxy-L-arabinose transferase-like glycosyltransferase
MSETEHESGAGDGSEPDGERDAPPSDAGGQAKAPARNGAAHVAPPADEEAPADEPGPAADATGDAEAEEPVLPEGNPLRYLRGTLAILVGAFTAFVLMALGPQYRFGVPIGALGVFIATFGVLDFAGSFDDPEDRVAGRAKPGALVRPLGLLLGGAVALFILVCLAVDGRLSATHPVLAAGVLIPASFLVTVIGGYELGDCFGAWEAEASGERRPLLHRHGFWLVLVTTLLYLPMLGSHSLSDPWETHYGEVSREILARNDWISTWWAQDGWFWSKPVLDFWIQALAMASFGVHYHSNDVLGAVREGRIPWPEWAVRLPVFLLTLLAVYLLYKAVARVFGRRAGLLGGVVLVTMPQWYLLANQTMTDMPFVAPMAAAMACLLLGAHADPDEEVKVYELDLGLTKLRFSGYHLVVGAIVACALPQILYLLSRNVPLDIRGFHFRLDAFSAGSPDNCGLPGNESCHPAAPVLHGLHPALQALIWAQALALVVYLNWGERRGQRLWFLAAWLFAALSTLAKGPAGFGLPALCALAYLVASQRTKKGQPQRLPLLRLLSDMTRLEITSGVLILLAVAMPWYVAMYARHGQPFTDRLIFHDMFKRAFTHVHDTNEGDDTSFRFYVWQLGYAMFPWTGLVPAGLVYWLKWREEDDSKADASVFLAMWFVFAFALFSLMLTKFHHYILPALPPAAMLTGVLLDAMIRSHLDAPAHDGGPESPPNPPGSGQDGAPGVRSRLDTAIYAVGLGAGTVAALYGATWLVTLLHAPLPPGPLKGLSSFGRLGVPAMITGLGVSGIVATVLLAGRAAPGGALAGEDGEGVFRARFERVMFGAAGVAGAFLVLAVGRDMAETFEGMPNQIRFWHLVTYNYRRPWPPSLDFTPAFTAITLAAGLILLALAFARLRRHVVSLLVAFGLASAGWGMNVYLMKVSPHWGQRETTIAYYQAALEVPGPLVAYQMNWKGENFYTGNHVPAFVSSGKKFQDYITEEKKKGVKTFYFVTEHGRAGTLSNELGPTKAFEKLTPPELDNKFGLVRARFE